MCSRKSRPADLSADSAHRRRYNHAVSLRHLGDGPPRLWAHNEKTDRTHSLTPLESVYPAAVVMLLQSGCVISSLSIVELFILHGICVIVRREMA